MINLKRTQLFSDRLRGLRYQEARIRIGTRLDRLADGTAGQSRNLGEGVTELKIDYGPGYRVYFTRRGLEIVLFLCGGDKSSQRKDIEAAKRLARQIAGGASDED